MFRKSRRILTTLLRRSCAALLVVAFVASLVGMPVVKTAAKDRSRPFPCQDRPCGCASAEQCWKKCCCFNNQQKREWAKEHHVALPADFPADEEQADAVDPKASNRIACADDGAPCTDGHDAVNAKASRSSCGGSCCEKSSAVASSRTSDEQQNSEAESACSDGEMENDESKLEVGLVIGKLARECQGLPSIWTLLTTPMLPEVPVTWTYDWSVVGCVADVPIHPCSAELSPPAPPPRLSAPSAPSTSCA